MAGAYATIDEIVMEVIADLGESGTHKYDQYLNYALRGAREWHYDSAQEIKTVRLPMLSYNAIDWPEDYVDWCKIGIQVGERVKTLGVNDESLALYFENGNDECGNPIPNAPVADTLPSDLNGYGGYYYYNYFNQHGENEGKLFGYGGGGQNPNGTWKLNRERKQFQFDACINTTYIYLEYISDGFTPCGSSVINKYAANMLRKYIHWQKSVFKEGAASGNSQKWESEYYTEYARSRGRVFSISISEILDATRANYKLSIKN